MGPRGIVVARSGIAGIRGRGPCIDRRRPVIGAATYCLAIPLGLTIAGALLGAQSLPGSLALMPAGLTVLLLASFWCYLLFAPLLPVSCLAGVLWSVLTTRLNGSKSGRPAHLITQLGFVAVLIAVTIAAWIATIVPVLSGLSSGD